MNAYEVSHSVVLDALALAIRDHDWNRQAAVRLLIEHGYWTRRLAFLDHVNLDVDHAGRRVASIDFGALVEVVDRSRASSSEHAVLRLACHLAGHLPERATGDLAGWTLAAILKPLDRTNARLVVEAITYRGDREHVVRRGGRRTSSRTCRTLGCRRRGWEALGSLRYCPSCGGRMAQLRGVWR